ncbi:hypothetical protein SAMN02910456_01967 [Ruminococcaceae bacterium YRB3002]|nr:hypothetical protein SAMN02910456_01967 [Ruminococcaceae bacterium YRB3002]
MSKKIAKKIIAVAMIVSCLVGMAYSSNAANINVSFGGNKTPGYSSSTFNPHSTNATAQITSVGFIGVPPEVWPYNKSIWLSLYRNGAVQTSWVKHTSKYTVKSISGISPQNANYNVGAKTDNSTGATINVNIV